MDEGRPKNGGSSWKHGQRYSFALGAAFVFATSVHADSTSGSALRVVDSKGKTVGPLTTVATFQYNRDSSFSSVTPVDIAAITVSGKPYNVPVSKSELACDVGTAVWFESSDCSGPAFLIFVPDQGDRFVADGYVSNGSIYYASGPSEDRFFGSFQDCNGTCRLPNPDDSGFTFEAPSFPTKSVTLTQLGLTPPFRVQQ